MGKGARACDSFSSVGASVLTREFLHGLDHVEECLALDRAAFGTDAWSRSFWGYALTHDTSNNPIIGLRDTLGELVGCVQLQRNANEFMIGTFAVSPSVQKQGVGSAVMFEVLQLALSTRGINWVWAITDESNVAMQVLSAKFGLSVQARIASYHGGGTPRLVLWSEDVTSEGLHSRLTQLESKHRVAPV